MSWQVSISATKGIKHRTEVGTVSTEIVDEFTDNEVYQENVFLLDNLELGLEDQLERMMDEMNTEQVVENDKAMEEATTFLLKCCSHFNNLRNGGNQWAGWIAYLSFFRHVAKLDLPEYDKFQHYENAAIHGGPRFMHEQFWIVSDFPTKLSIDEQNRPHAQNGPFCAWSDGWTLWYVRGVNVPAEWVQNPQGIDPKIALTHQNTEQRRIAAELVGWQKVLDMLKPRVVDKHPDPKIGELLEVDLPDAPGEKFLKVLCGTGRTFVLCVPRESKTALEAQTSMWPGLTEQDILEMEARA